MSNVIPDGANQEVARMAIAWSIAKKITDLEFIGKKPSAQDRLEMILKNFNTAYFGLLEPPKD